MQDFYYLLGLPLSLEPINEIKTSAERSMMAQFDERAATNWDGQVLSAVQFIWDYIILDFSEYKLTLFIWPDITVDNVTVKKQDINYRNLLCELIGSKVIKFHDENDLEILIHLENMKALHINLRSHKHGNSDKALLWHNDRFIKVW